MPKPCHMANLEKIPDEIVLLSLEESRDHLMELCNQVLKDFSDTHNERPRIFECEASLELIETAITTWTENCKGSLGVLTTEEFKAGAQHDWLLGPIITKAKLYLKKDK
ncbi:hypothetical protein CHUAL_009654 [Chamberlinius hualienensis]